MRTPEEIHRAITHWREAQAGCAWEGAKLDDPLNREHADRREKIRQDLRVKEAMASRIVDALNWVMGYPSEFADQLRKYEEIDRVRQIGRQGRIQ